MNIFNNSFNYAIQPTVNSSAASTMQSNPSIPMETETNPLNSSIAVITPQTQPNRGVDLTEPMELFNHLLLIPNRMRDDVELVRQAILQNPNRENS